MKRPNISISGECTPQFHAVRRVFEQNFHEREELGAAVGVYLDGKPVVDLWGGFFDVDRTTPWARDTIVCMASVSKTVAALCLHQLSDNGRVDLDSPVARYWPEFGRNGKGEITVRHVLGHMAALPYTDTVPEYSLFEWDPVIGALEDMEPAWAPGTKGAYHTTTYGHLVGELVKRVSGQSIGTYCANHISKPLALDYHIGLPAEAMERVSRFILNPVSKSNTIVFEAGTPLGRMFAAFPPMDDPFNSRRFREVEFPSANGHGNARAMARLFGALARGGELDGVRLLSPEAIARATEQQLDDVCPICGDRFRVSLGFVLNTPDGKSFMGPNRRTFGATGAGGALGFGDPDAKMSFGYSPNFGWHMAEGLGERCRALVSAAYSCL